MKIKNTHNCEIGEIHKIIIDEIEKILGDDAEQFWITSTNRRGAGYHSTGHAVDVASHDLKLQRKLFDTLRANYWPGGLGLSRVAGNVHVHIDRRPNGKRVRWMETDEKGNGPLEGDPGFKIEYNRYIKEFG